LAEVENNYLRQVLDETKGNKKRVAEIMGIDRKTLSRMVERHKIDMEMIKTKG
jgi:DNA-binding protein Fis